MPQRGTIKIMIKTVRGKTFRYEAVKAFEKMRVGVDYFFSKCVD